MFGCIQTLDAEVLMLDDAVDVATVGAVDVDETTTAAVDVMTGSSLSEVREDVICG